MTRPIKFRGFHATDSGDTTIYIGGKVVMGRWVYGSYVVVDNQRMMVLPDSSKDVDDFMPVCLRVIQETVGQFTGLTDENGKQIFDGDKVAFSEFDYNGADKPMEGTVYWCGTSFWIDCTEKYGDEVVWGLQHAFDQDPCMIVTGTIFDKEG